MNVIIVWVVPPLIGAIIGYITNAVAIKMLFRPFKEIRVFGIRLPFTPGILPRERKKLAESIGRMVEQELLTPGVLKERLAKEEVRVKLENTLGSYTEQMLEKPLSYWLEDSSDKFPVADIANDFVNGEVFDSFLEEMVRSWLLGSSTGKESGKEKNKEGSIISYESISQKLKSNFKDFGSLFVPTAKSILKNGLVKEMKKRSQGGRSSYRHALESIIEKYPNITTKEFISLGNQKKSIVDSFLTTKTLETLDKNIEGALTSVDIKLLVTDRINALDMPRVEKIILDVMAGQLKWINFFGAILGALIGFSEVLLSVFLR